MEIRFLVRIRGALTPPPRMDEPVMKMPLRTFECYYDPEELALMLESVPGSPNDGQSDAERDAQVCPCVRRDGFEECADLEGSSCEQGRRADGS